MRETVSIGYNFDRDDLYLEAPEDICRTKREDFLSDLLARINDGLVDDAGSPVEFNSFHVFDRFDGNGKDAATRFVGNWQGEPQIQMMAVGPIDPQNCEIGEMTGYVGWNYNATESYESFPIQ